MTGIIEGFFGGEGVEVEIFHSGMFLGRKIWQVFFWVA